MRTIDTPYGPLTIKHYAGPTTAPGRGYLNDGKHPSAAHAAGRAPDARYVDARVRSPEHQDGGYRVCSPLTINGKPYEVDAGFTLTADGWRADRSDYHALTPAGAFLTMPPTPAARRTWDERIVPAIIATLTADTQAIETARTDARMAFVADCRDRAAMLRAEADRLDALTED